MKTIIYIGILGTLLTTGLTAEAQIADARNFRNDDAGIVINNYYNYDFHYSSRINRFHRSYVAFSYYSPVFTDVYWYSYQPFTWGLTIYGGGRLGVGITYNYPVYYRYWDNPWYYGWDYAWYGRSYYWDYDPFYITWYRPVVVNIRVGSWWPRTYYSYHGRNHWDYGYRPVYNNYNYYFNNTSSTNKTAPVNVSRRVTPSTTSGTQTFNSSADNTSPANRRGVPADNRGNQYDRIHRGDQGNNNSLNPGNTNNVNRGANSGNNPGRGNNSRQGNQDQGNARRPVISTPSSTRTQTGVLTPSRPADNRSKVSGRPSGVSTGRDVNTNQQTAVSQGSRRTSTTSVSPKPSVSSSKKVVSKSSSSGKSESEKSKSSDNSATRRR